MKRKKKSRTEFREWWDAREARIQKLRELVAKGEAELAAKRAQPRPPQ